MKKSTKIHLKQHFLMQTLQAIHFVYFCFGFHFFYIAYQGKDIVFRFIIEYNSLTKFGPHVVGVILCEDF
jgi:hypothetical protein